MVVAVVSYCERTVLASRSHRCTPNYTYRSVRTGLLQYLYSYVYSILLWIVRGEWPHPITRARRWCLIVGISVIVSYCERLARVIGCGHSP